MGETDAEVPAASGLSSPFPLLVSLPTHGELSLQTADPVTHSVTRPPTEHLALISQRGGCEDTTAFHGLPSPGLAPLQQPDLASKLLCGVHLLPCFGGWGGRRCGLAGTFPWSLTGALWTLTSQPLPTL